MASASVRLQTRCCCARLRSFTDALQEHSGEKVHVMDDFLAFEAMGAARLAA